jgi:hypothetical protein
MGGTTRSLPVIVTEVPPMREPTVGVMPVRVTARGEKVRSWGEGVVGKEKGSESSR